MKRILDMNEISDGRFYALNDLVKADCNDCKGCSACCRGMGNSIQLDPLDIYRLTVNLSLSFEQLLQEKIELNVVEGLILPNLKMAGAEEQCAFLNEQGRCSIHAIRPGICRIFPLGRYYENHSFQYFLQVNECKKTNKTKIKVQKWIDTPNIKENEAFITEWHYFLENVKEQLNRKKDDNFSRQVNMYLLTKFYIEPYQKEKDFYIQFQERMNQAGIHFG